MKWGGGGDGQGARRTHAPSMASGMVLTPPHTHAMACTGPPTHAMALRPPAVLPDCAANRLVHYTPDSTCTWFTDHEVLRRSPGGISGTTELLQTRGGTALCTGCALRAHLLLAPALYTHENHDVPRQCKIFIVSSRGIVIRPCHMILLYTQGTVRLEIGSQCSGRTKALQRVGTALHRCPQVVLGDPRAGTASYLVCWCLGFYLLALLEHDLSPVSLPHTCRGGAASAPGGDDNDGEAEGEEGEAAEAGGCGDEGGKPRQPRRRARYCTTTSHGPRSVTSKPSERCGRGATAVRLMRTWGTSGGRYPMTFDMGCTCSDVPMTSRRSALRRSASMARFTPALMASPKKVTSGLSTPPRAHCAHVATRPASTSARMASAATDRRQRRHDAVASDPCAWTSFARDTPAAASRPSMFCVNTRRSRRSRSRRARKWCVGDGLTPRG